MAGWSKYPNNNLDLDDSWPHALAGLLVLFLPSLWAGAHNTQKSYLEPWYHAAVASEFVQTRAGRG